MNSASVTYEIVSSSTYVQMESQKERGERVKQKKFKDTMAENFPSLMKTVNPHIEKPQRTLSRRNIKKATLRPIMIF